MAPRRTRALAVLAIAAAAQTQPVPFPWDGATARGVLIYAVGPKYLSTAKQLVDSIRANDEALPILVVYASGLAKKFSFDTSGPHTRLVSVPNPANEGRTERDRAGASHRAMGGLRRGRFDALGRSPFRTTLYVDADALACRSLASIFATVEANQSQWAFCEKNNHFHKKRDGSLYHAPRDEKHAIALFKDFDLKMPELTSPFANAGFLVYRPFDAEVQALLRTWRRVYDYGYAKKVSADQPALWVAQRNTPGLRIQVLDVTASCRVHDSFSQCGRFSARPANFVTEHTRRARDCVLIHGHNLSAAPRRGTS